MTDKILELAKEAGAELGIKELSENKYNHAYLFIESELEAFANLIRADDANTITSLRNQLAECQKYAERYHLLKKNYVMANFNIYDDKDFSIGKSGVIIEMPNGIEYNADLDFIVDQAKAMSEKG